MTVDEETLTEVMISEIHRPDMQRKTLKVDDMRFPLQLENVSFVMPLKSEL